MKNIGAKLLLLVTLAIAFLVMRPDRSKPATSGSGRAVPVLPLPSLKPKMTEPAGKSFPRRSGSSHSGSIEERRERAGSIAWVSWMDPSQPLASPHQFP